MADLDAFRDFASLPWVRCPSCGKVTSRFQKAYDGLLANKEDDYYSRVEETYLSLLTQGFDDMTAQKLASTQARIYADTRFNQRVRTELGINRLCCMRTLQNPIVMPLGSGVELDPEVDVGQRMSTLGGSSGTRVRRVLKAN